MFLYSLSRNVNQSEGQQASRNHDFQVGMREIGVENSLRRVN
ncbi:hypothetical protein CPter91_4750 [Collimonas pratensis]|uniref:Uncharacterized protein n=1 Tax=Collimonas pratensis TaxID=279113 RepID=A0A127QB15_9BURK|nr:hypothetical protein CPter91_4750 [Collimonas pratensis]